MRRPYSKAFICNELDNFLDDASNTRWTAEEKLRCINQAIEDAWPLWYIEEIEDGLQSTANNDFDYDVPQCAEDIIGIWRERSATEPYKLEKSWFVLGDTIYTEEEWEHPYKLRIAYIRKPRRLLDKSGTDGVVNAGALTTFSSASSDFATEPAVQPGDKLTIYNATTMAVIEWALVVRVQDANTLIVDRDLTAGTNLAFYINRYTDVPINYLLHRAAYYCYLLLAEKGAKGDVDQHFKMARFHYSASEAILERQKKRWPTQKR